MNKMDITLPIYGQEEIREAHKRVKADIENGHKNQRGIALAMELQDMCLKYLTNIMTEEEINMEESEETEPEDLDKE